MSQEGDDRAERRRVSLDPRRSFSARVAATLLGTVGFLILSALFAVRIETARQVDEAARRAVEQSDALFDESRQVMGAQLARIADAFTGSVRAVALLDAAIEEGDLDYLVGTALYDLALQNIESSLIVFTDAWDEPLLTLLDGARSEDPDPAGVSLLAEELLDTEGMELQAFRLVGDRLFALQVRAVELGPRLIGTVTVGFPVTDPQAASLGAGGTEVCLVVEGRCVAGSPLARGELRPRMETLALQGGRKELEVRGARWELVAAPLDPGRAGDGLRVIAVPLDDVLAPFGRIVTALLLAAAASLALAVVASVVLARSLARPVHALVGATERIAEGDFRNRVDDRRRDELGRLASAFNRMSEGLLLKEHYRGVLDKVVSREAAEELLRGEIALGGENREVTVLFADIRGFTSATEGMEPQEVIALLNASMSLLSHAVETEGGVVDKYVGDEIMAVFGAPVEQGDDPFRAVRAALRMQDAVGDLNAEREREGRAPVRLGIGIGTGLAVAGNMGSPDRLNYTVLGEAVNLASRLCEAAGPGEILVSPATWAAAAGRVAGRLRGGVELKGFSRPVDVYEIDPTGAFGPSGPPGTGPGAVVSILLAAVLALAPAAGAAAQDDRGLPTLRGLGVGYLSPDGFLQVDLSGRMDIEAFRPGDPPPWLIPETEAFVAPRLRLVTDVFVGERVYGMLELSADRGLEPAARSVEGRVDQVFLRLHPRPGTPLSFQAGRFASPFGGFAARHRTPDDPFLRPPLAYEHRTILSPVQVPADARELFDRHLDPGRWQPGGSPVIWAIPYQWGVALQGAVGPVELGAAAMNSVPSSGPVQWEWDGDRVGEPSLVGRLSWPAAAWLRLSGYWTRGPWMHDPVVPAGAGGAIDRADFDQEILGLEAVLRWGTATLRGEVFDNRWEVPNLAGALRDRSYYVEASWVLAPGLRVAGRFNGFEPLEARPRDEGAPGGATVPRERWERSVTRWQAAAGYRIVANVGAGLEYARTSIGGPGRESTDLLAGRLWWSF